VKKRKELKPTKDQTIDNQKKEIQEIPLMTKDTVTKTT
jgi:hypothetical protein